MAITTRNGASTINLHVLTVEELRNNSDMIDEIPVVESEKLTGMDVDSENDNCKCRVDELNDNMHYYGAITLLPLVNKEDPKAFTILCSIGTFNVRQICMTLEPLSI